MAIRSSGWLNSVKGEFAIINDAKRLTDSLGLSVSYAGDRVKAMWSALTPTGKIGLIIAGIGLLVTAIQAISTAIKNSQKSVEDWQKDVDDAKGRVDDLNDKLKTNQDRLEEINKLHGTSDWTVELENERKGLEEVNDQLKLRLEYEERRLELANQGLRAAARTALYETKGAVGPDGTPMSALAAGTALSGGGTVQWLSPTEHVQEATRALNELAEAKRNLDATDPAYWAQLQEIEDQEKAWLDGVEASRQAILSAIDNGTVDAATARELQGFVDALANAEIRLSKTTPQVRQAFINSMRAGRQEVAALVERRNELMQERASLGDPLGVRSNEIDEINQRLSLLYSNFALFDQSEQTLSSLFSELDQFQSGALSVAEFNEKVKELLTLIAALQGADPTRFTDEWAAKLRALFGIGNGATDYVSAFVAEAAPYISAAVDAGDAVGAVVRGHMTQAFGQMSQSELDAFIAWLREQKTVFPTVTAAVDAYRISVSKAADAVDELRTSFSNMKELDDFKNKVAAMDKVFGSMKENGAAGFDELKGLYDAFTDKDGNEQIDNLQDYIDRLSALRNDAAGTQNVLNEMLTAYVQNKLSVEDLADANVELVEALLKEAGVSNAAAVAANMVTEAQIKQAAAAGDVEQAAEAAINALNEEERAAFDAAMAVARTASANLGLNNTQVSLSSSIASLSGLAGTSGSATIAVQALIGVLSRLAKLDASVSASAGAETAALMEVVEGQTYNAVARARQHSAIINEIAENVDIMAMFNEELQKAKETYNAVFTGTGGGGGGGSKKDPVDELLEPYKKAKESIEGVIQQLQHQYDELKRQGRDADSQANVQQQINYYLKLQQAAHEMADALRDYYRAQGMADDEIEEQAKLLELSNDWWEAYESILELNEKELERLKESLSEAGEALDQFRNIYKTLIDAADQYHTDGFLQLDTLKSILDFGPEYLQFLRDEAGALRYDEEALQRVIAAKTEEMAVDTALSYLQQIRTALVENDAKALLHLTDIINTATDSVWALVDAQLAELQAGGLTDAQYENVVQNIATLRNITRAATDAIAQYGKSLHSSYLSQEEAVDQVFELTKKYVQWELEQQAEALEKQKEQYDDLIDRRKELLDLQKKELDHDKSVEKKLREIAKLQVRIDLLGLDTSREAKAERAKLEEQLAEKTSDLADEQNSYFIDAQKDALDKEKTAFDKEKDAEIKKLKETLDSEEELYQATLSRLTDAWTNGWSGFYEKLKAWNREYGSDLEKTLTQAFSVAEDAYTRFGGVAEAMSEAGVSGDQWIYNPNQAATPSKSGQQAALVAPSTEPVEPSTPSSPTDPGIKTSKADQTLIDTYIKTMQANAEEWRNSSSETEKKELEQENIGIAEQIKKLYRKYDSKYDLVRDDNGRWYHYKVGGKRLYYRQGGVVDYDGIGILHGGKAAEMVLNNVDVAKVYELIHNTPSLVGSMARNLITSIPGALRSANGIGTLSAPITVNISHNGSMTDADARRYGNAVADTALGRLQDAFARRGMTNVRLAALKA